MPLPLLSLSSEVAGWEDLVVQAFHEPMELESWVRPATSDQDSVPLNLREAANAERGSEGSVPKDSSCCAYKREVNGYSTCPVHL